MAEGRQLHTLFPYSPLTSPLLSLCQASIKGRLGLLICFVAHADCFVLFTSPKRTTQFAQAIRRYSNSNYLSLPVATSPLTKQPQPLLPYHIIPPRTSNLLIRQLFICSAVFSLAEFFMVKSSNNNNNNNKIIDNNKNYNYINYNHWQTLLSAPGLGHGQVQRLTSSGFWDEPPAPAPFETISSPFGLSICKRFCLLYYRNLS